ncbi:unnamed protein product [Schistosoma margrebowiei]|uniref:Uncharacterized protein n=1 Tax=Schistosoma margrebowiei TaxID=48269 RepID=A0A183MTW9_9TREM|nr:unnamed protein product [Schistosoma margrebowiei]
MQLDDLNIADHLPLLSHLHQQMQVKTTSVAATSASVSFNMYKGENKIFKYNTENANPPNYTSWRNSGTGENFHLPTRSASSMKKQDPMQT